MFSLHPVPGNPWPHDMAIRIDEDAQSLLQLLWIREAWGLDPGTNRADDDHPPKLALSPAPVSESQRESMPIGDWQDAWPALWDACLRHAATPFDDDAFRRVGSLAPGSPERETALHELVGPMWSDRFGEKAFAEGYRPWEEQVAEQRRAVPVVPVDEHPERLSLDALVPAWRAGLTNIVEIPCIGTFTRAVGAHGMLVTAETRADPARYAEALESFRPERG